MALADNRDTKERASAFAFDHEVVGIDSEEFYKGQLLQIDLSNGKVGGATVGSASGKQVCGVCLERKSTGSSNTKTVRFKSGIHYFASGTAGEAITAANIGDVCYVLDDDTVGIAGNAGANAIAGRVYDVDSNGVAVAIHWPLPQLAPVGPTGA